MLSSLSQGGFCNFSLSFGKFKRTRSIRGRELDVFERGEPFRYSALSASFFVCLLYFYTGAQYSRCRLGQYLIFLGCGRCYRKWILEALR